MREKLTTRGAINQNLSEAFQRPIELIAAITAEFTSDDVLASIAKDKQSGVVPVPIWVESFEQELAKHQVKDEIAMSRPGWVVQNISAFTAPRPWDSRRLFLVTSLKSEAETNQEIHGLDLVAVLPDGKVSILKLDGWPRHHERTENTFSQETQPAILVGSEEPGDSNWWRNYVLTPEQEAMLLQAWQDDRDELLKGIDTIIQNGGGGIAGRSGSWHPRMEGLPSFTIQLLFYIPPVMKGYFSPAGKQSLLRSLESYYNALKASIETC